MKSHDAPQLSSYLSRLAETFDRKPLTAEALKVWFDTLKEFPAELVLGMLTGWPKGHHKFPVPAEVWKIINDIQTADRERAAADLRRDNVRFVDFSGKTEGGRRMAQEIRGIVSMKKPSPVEHWHRILSTHAPESIGHTYALEALAKLRWKKREPGEDSEAA